MKKGQNPNALRRNKSQTNLIRYQSRYSCNGVCSVIVSTCSRLRGRAGRLAEALAMVKLLSVTVTLCSCRAPGCFTAQVPHQQITHKTPGGFPRLTESFLPRFVLFVKFGVNSGERDKSHHVFSDKDTSWTSEPEFRPKLRTSASVLKELRMIKGI